jgi:hypothetical protein
MIKPSFVQRARTSDVAEGEEEFMTGYDKIKKFVSEVHEINCALTDEIIEFIDEVILQEQVGNVPQANACPQLCEVTELIIDAVNIDGAHHKQWYLEQIAVKLGIELPEHEKGIIP